MVRFEIKQLETKSLKKFEKVQTWLSTIHKLQI